ncbi:UDP-N-acetylmuramoyl-L-alanyl-D-glutamate--2,6-diaminopimelate ligase [Undibacterium sp.]|uniref:UDP-N-acetylmuramoyl-L-alanyl-D-glutamate--2, 6-diaminopimelate ligase n=1 Tax=Undibacterium sp. TaxID=1914977 RepID=UPI002C0C4B58|nr:UDP-N-acetylmuramoyl-L-alanyl-D-glutamate--2,6-diaminopimelate ligase [Undibacterium sp.]HTD05492.1 UDP-N-acetylmuramoyl-L-alanyl-D-glutamate--2,6-diaminopimelate ligase [Undibacterium sp.]
MTEIIEWLRQVAPGAQLSSDSRAIKTGDVFFAFPIGSGDGRRHLQQAISNGAAAVVYESHGFSWDDTLAVPHKGVAQLQQQLGPIANAYYAQPDQAMLTVAVTGTNGKTSCSQWLAKAFSLLGKPGAVVGTLGVGMYKDGVVASLEETGFTTPDAVQLQRRLAELRDAGATALAIEASSIGLQQGRLNGLHFDVAVFTNLTRDHLDYHGSMEAYAEAKARLFDWPALGAAVVNMDDQYGPALAQRLQEKQAAVQLIGYTLENRSHAGVAMLSASNLRTQHAGTSFHVDSPFGCGQVKTHLIGRFNVSNVLAVLAVLLAKGYAWNKAVDALEMLEAVPGRMQQLGSQGHAMVVIDYAHTPDALEKTVQTLQQVAQERHGELWCVFGCGGDRDPGKRPLMGRIAEQADHVVVTSDNPRTEKPADIIAQIVAGMSKPAHVIEDRASAILYAIKHAGDHDVVLLAGKGHEAYQDINGKKWPFSDEQHASLALATVATSGNMKRPN